MSFQTHLSLFYRSSQEEILLFIIFLQPMTKKEKLKFCNAFLLFMTIIMLATSIFLEATGSRSITCVCVHIAVGSLFAGNVAWHLYLHYEWKSWFGRLRKQKSTITRWLALSGLLTFTSGIITTLHWIATQQHSPFGGVHGKIGFAFLLLAIAHTAKRWRFFKMK